MFYETVNTPKYTILAEGNCVVLREIDSVIYLYNSALQGSRWVW